MRWLISSPALISFPSHTLPNHQNTLHTMTYVQYSNYVINIHLPLITPRCIITPWAVMSLNQSDGHNSPTLSCPILRHPSSSLTTEAQEGEGPLPGDTRLITQSGLAVLSPRAALTPAQHLSGTLLSVPFSACHPQPPPTRPHIAFASLPVRQFPRPALPRRPFDDRQ